MGVEEEQFQRELKEGTVSLRSLDSPRADAGCRRSPVPRHAVAGALGLGLAGHVSYQERVGEQRGKSVFDFSQRDVEQHESTFRSEGEKRGSLAFLEAYREREGASCRAGVHQQVVAED